VSCKASARIGFARDLRAVWPPCNRSCPALRLRGHLFAAQPALFRRRRDPFSGLGSLSQYHRCSPRSPRPCRNTSSATLRPRFVPLQRFAERAEPRPPAASQSAGAVAPPGFCTLSTPCSPRALPGLFHPGSALGVSLRGFAPPAVPYALSSAASPGFSVRSEERSSPSGMVHTTESPPAGPGFSRMIHVGAPLGFVPPRFLARAHRSAHDRSASPPALCRFGRFRPPRRGPRVSSLRRRSRPLAWPA
jgi:hypothetical protein